MWYRRRLGDTPPTVSLSWEGFEEGQNGAHKARRAFCITLGARGGAWAWQGVQQKRVPVATQAKGRQPVNTALPLTGCLEMVPKIGRGSQQSAGRKRWIGALPPLRGWG